MQLGEPLVGLLQGLTQHAAGRGQQQLVRGAARALSMIAGFTWLGQAHVSLPLNDEACQHQEAGSLLRSGLTPIGQGSF